MQSNLYLAIHGFLVVIFAIRIIRLRWKLKVSLGHGDKIELISATRVFGNHNEYTPIFLIFLYVCETQGASNIFIHSMGILFTFGRIAHAIGLTIYPQGRSKGRFIGMTSTFISLIACSAFLLKVWIRL